MHVFTADQYGSEHCPFTGNPTRLKGHAIFPFDFSCRPASIYSFIPEQRSCCLLAHHQLSGLNHLLEMTFVSAGWVGAWKEGRGREGAAATTRHDTVRSTTHRSTHPPTVVVLLLLLLTCLVSVVQTRVLASTENIQSTTADYVCRWITAFFVAVAVFVEFGSTSQQ